MDKRLDSPHGDFPRMFQFSSVAQSCPTLCNPMDCNTSGLPVHHQLPELTQTHVLGISDAIQPSHPLSPPSPPAFNLFQYKGLFQWVSSLHQVAKVLEFQLQHQSIQWIFRTNFIRIDWLDLLHLIFQYIISFDKMYTLIGSITRNQKSQAAATIEHKTCRSQHWISACKEQWLS